MSGAPLKPGLVLKARNVEMEYFGSKQVCVKRLHREATDAPARSASAFAGLMSIMVTASSASNDFN